MAEDAQLITGGKSVLVEKRDGSSERVTVRELPIRQLTRLLELQDDEAALVELYCDKPEGWADALTSTAHEQVLEEGAGLNFPILERWLNRKAAAVERLKPQVERILALAKP